MPYTVEPLKNAHHTAQKMYEIIGSNCQEMIPWGTLSVIEIYDLIKSIPFQKDPDGIEFLKAPRFTMAGIGPGGDCDDKSIALLSWARIREIPGRLIGVGRRVPGRKYGFFNKIGLTHVYPQLYIMGEWITYDPTYGINSIGQTLGPYDRVEIL